MDTFSLVTAGVPILYDPYALLMSFTGTLIGIVVGAIPGLGGAMALAIFLPFTFHMGEVYAMLLLLGIYMGATYGGSISAITVNIPGTASAIATTLDGYKMALKGQAGEAIGYATLASGIGGILGILVLVFAAPPLASAALKFSAQEYTGIALMGITIIAYISFGSPLKGLIGGLIGFLLASVGQDLVTAYPRFDFGSRDLLSGLDMIAVLVGFFGLTEVLTNLERQTKIKSLIRTIGNVLPSIRNLLRMSPLICVSSAIGVFVGAVPAAGGAIAALGAYGVQKRFSKRPEDFGTGIPEGVVAPESANNAAVGGALIPTLTLGIPGDPQTAVLLGALLIHGLNPGPQLFTSRPDLISAIYLANLLSIVIFVVIGLLGARYWARLALVPHQYLLPAILVFSVVGVFAVRNSVFDIWTFFATGVAGYLLQKIGIMPAPIVLGFVLGPIFEENLRRSLIMSNGDWTTFLTRPLSLTFVLINLFILFGPMVLRRRGRPVHS